MKEKYSFSASSLKLNRRVFSPPLSNAFLPQYKQMLRLPSMMIISWGEQILSNSSRVTVYLFINFDMPLAIVSPSSFFLKISVVLLMIIYGQLSSLSFFLFFIFYLLSAFPPRPRTILNIFAYEHISKLEDNRLKDPQQEK